MLALFAMVAIQAQNLLSEDFENGIPSTWLNIDADNDGNSWLSSAGVSGVSGHNGSDGCAFSCSYYNGTVLTPNNWLITPAVTLTGAATLTFWVAAQDASYAAEHYGVYISTNGGTSTSDFTLLYEETLDANGGARVQGTWKQKTVNLANYSGQTIRIAFRHFNCTDMFYMNIDDVVIFAQPTDPTIVANPTALDFGTIILGNNGSAQTNVQSYNLTAGVTATTAAPFAVSADGNTFATTATLAAAGGTLYVQYAPTAVGTDNGTVTLASTGATDVTLTLTGAAIDCGNNPIPYSYSFTTDAGNQCWEVINANNDDYTFEFNTTEGYASIRWNGSLAMDDWLVSPTFALTGAQTGSFDYRAGSTSYFEKFQVFAFGANDTVALTPVVEAHLNTYETQYLDLSSLTGNYKIAIHGISDADQLRLYIANFNVFAGAVPASLTLSTDTLDFSIIASGTTSTPKFVIMNTVSVNEAFTLTATAPFEVSLDGTNFAATQTIPANSALTTADTIYVRFAPTAVNTFAGTLSITSTSYNETVTLLGESADCSGNISTFPFVYDFNTGIYPPICWGYNNADNYWAATVSAGDYAMGIEGLEMLVTPEISSTSEMALLFDYRCYLGDNYDENPTSFRVGYSTTNSAASSFTWIETVDIDTYPEEGNVFFLYSHNIPANAKYVAIDITNMATFESWLGTLEDVIYIDNFKLVTEGDMFVNPESMDFGSVIAGSTSNAKTATVNTALLSSAISVTAPANFEVSSNGTSFAATASIPATGGTLYVRYAPSAAGNHSGNITLTSGSVTKNIQVIGSAVDCSAPQTLPFTEDFEGDLDACWSILDQDGDGYSWESSFNPVSYYSGVDLSGSGHNESDGFYMSGSYSNVMGALTPDNWLITPALTIPSSGATLTWYVSAVDENYAEEYYEVMLSTSLNPSNFTSVFNETLEAAEWEERTINIGGNWAGQNVYIAFRNHNTSDIFLMKIDDINVTAGVGVENHELNATIFPNPAKNVLNINANSNINRVEVYNMMGQMVGMYEANDVNTQINTTSFANGVYTVKINTENGTSTQKFTVAR